MQVWSPGLWRGKQLSDQLGIFSFPRTKSAPAQQEAAIQAPKRASALALQLSLPAELEAVV